MVAATLGRQVSQPRYVEGAFYTVDSVNLADDPVHKLLLDRDPVSGERLASQPTLSRFENAVNGCALYRMAEELVTRVIERHRRRLDGRARCITIDLDPTDDPTHGAQQHTLFNGYYDDVVEARSFARMLEQTIRRHQNCAIEPAQVVEELIAITRDWREAGARNETLALSDDELAFYEALGVNDSAVRVLGDETLRDIARELVETVRCHVSRLVRRVLWKHGYPPDKQVGNPNHALRFEARNGGRRLYLSYHITWSPSLLALCSRCKATTCGALAVPIR